MDITTVKVYPVHEEKLKAFVSVVFDHCFMVNDIKVIQGKDGLFLSMPSRRKKSGEFKDVAHPLNNGTRRMLEERVLEEYREVSRDHTPRRPDREAEAAEAQSVAEAQPVKAPPAAAAEAAHRGNGHRPAAVAAAPEPAPPESVPVPVPETPAGEKTLEEVQEMHLSDSFWSVP